MSLVGVVFRWKVHETEADATYLIGTTILVTYVTLPLDRQVERIRHLQTSNG